jgi:hypothetical protein
MPRVTVNTYVLVTPVNGTVVYGLVENLSTSSFQLVNIHTSSSEVRMEYANRSVAS